MNKHRGSNFNDYLKERGLLKEVLTLARKRWEVLCSEVPLETENTTEVSSNPPKRSNNLLDRLRHRINHLFS